MKQAYFGTLYKAVVRKEVDLDIFQQTQHEYFMVLPWLFQSHTCVELHNRGRRSSSQALEYWKTRKSNGVIDQGDAIQLEHAGSVLITNVFYNEWISFQPPSQIGGPSAAVVDFNQIKRTEIITIPGIRNESKTQDLDKKHELKLPQVAWNRGACAETF